MRERLDALPDPQARTLRALLGAGDPAGGDRFLSGLAVLTLLAEVADDGPVLCLVDDAQWLDRASTDALLFAARRLAAEGVAMVFATREEGLPGTGLPELRPARLPSEDAERLLEDRGLTPPSREQVIEESAGNPLALIEFAAAQRRHHTVAGPLPVTDRVLASFRARIGRLPEQTRLMMLTAAAEARGHLPTLLGAAEALGVGLEHLAEAEKAGLVEVSANVVAFSHPLIGTAAYHGAPLARRVAVHQALADAATDADCRARHLAAASTSADEGVAAEVVRAAERARARTAHATAAGLYEQAANLSRPARPRLPAGRGGLARAVGRARRAGGAPGRPGRGPGGRSRVAGQAGARAGGRGVRAGRAPPRRPGAGRTLRARRRRLGRHHAAHRRRIRVVQRRPGRPQGRRGTAPRVEPARPDGAGDGASHGRGLRARVAAAGGVHGERVPFPVVRRGDGAARRHHHDLGHLLRHDPR
ncbi:hypothetical protein ACFQYP_11570 [Nonomuraea antimicrobica]